MKILFLTNLFYPHIGGIEVNSEILAGCFSQAGHEVRLVTWAAEPGDQVFPYPVLRNPGMWTLIRAHLWADVVFENNPCLKLAWPAFFLRKKSVVAMRTWIQRDGGQMGWQDRLKIKWLGRAAGVIAVSNTLREAYFGQAVVIGNPYRDQLFRRSATTPLPGTFVFLGRLVNDKGADLAIAAIARMIKADGLVLRLTVIGDGPELAQLKQMAVDLDIEKHVTFTGPLSGHSLVDVLNRHAYLLVPSQLKEPFGNVALEGMACGCVPIVSSGGGLPDAVGRAGLVFERGNLDALVDTIRTLLENPELEAQLRRNAAAHLSNHLPEIVALKYLAVIQQAYKKMGI